MPSSPKSYSSRHSEGSDEIEMEFINPKQVESLYSIIVDKYNDIQDEIEALEIIDDDIQELREETLNKYEFTLLAEAYKAAGQSATAEGLLNQAEECDERIEELQSSLEDIDVKEHIMELYELEIQRETLEIQMKACEKYLEKSKRKAYLETKKATIKPASPRRYPKAASPSRLNTEFGRDVPLKRDSPKENKDESREESSKPQNPLPLPTFPVIKKK
jgi:hypothetical protein